MYQYQFKSFLISLVFLQSCAWADVFNCANAQCGVQRDNAYPYIVTAIIEHIGTPKEAQKIFSIIRGKKYWQTLPNDARKFSENVRVVLLNTKDVTGKKRLVSMLMGEDEYQTAPLKKGDFVRYSPHGKNHNAPAIDTPESWAYWRLYGCIQVLCRTGDKACFSKYKSGIFDHETGSSINDKTNRVDLSVKGINPHSYLPQK